MKLKITIPDSVSARLGGAVSRGVREAEISELGHLLFTMTDGALLDLGSVIGPQGEKGDKGDTGDPGEKGEKGDPGTLTSVTASVDGTSGTPSVSVTYDGANAAFAFSGLKGAPGDKGDTGDPGEDGEDGEDGYTPVRGTDYWTASDKAEIVASASAAVIRTNPNLLDNWYFGNPVNQRGQSAYSQIGATYTVDRWKNLWNASLTVHSGYCTLSTTDTAQGYGYFVQPFENAMPTPVTMSLLTKDGNLYSTSGSTISLENGFTLNREASQIVIQSPESSATLDILAVKLELGSQQTLAHQENGVWVLNEIPNYGDELAKCQRYFYKGAIRGFMSDKPYGVAVFIPTPVQMRSGNITVIPSVDFDNFLYEIGGAYTVAQNATLYGSEIVNGGIRLYFYPPEVGTGVYIVSDGDCSISTDL